MKYNLELLKADIHDELENLKRLEQEFAKVEKMIDLSAEEVSYIDRGAIGYLLHNFYNGCENIFSSIARFFENDLGPQGWHKDLLKRMKLEISGFRPRVIDKELYRLLDDFRAFRHKFRHSYAFELDWEKECLVAKKLPQTAKMFRLQINNFLSMLEKIDTE
ncbi:MAG: antitoxin [Pseudomonadota bacterium]|uniref:Antitoxin n=1 Tax=Candidatus Desulfatibia profunda TaxID=2841695 RepID=A0A8J6NPR0_9BACT|nr:antitoxin [Candidatus Desulfatibia profunda]MBL7180961.1 antitoxin [Desulfobacterales bacterium]MBU0699663.1 antitoxin [Pseudomonadota bacterium]